MVALTRYTHSLKESDYAGFLAAMSIPFGDAAARRELNKPDFDLLAARAGFLEGGNHPDDVDGMIWLYRHFHDTRFMHEAVDLWAAADQHLQQLPGIAERAHALILAHQSASPEMSLLTHRIEEIDSAVTPLAEKFDRVLGASAREIETLLLLALISTASVLMAAGCWIYFLALRNLESTDRETRAARDRALELSRVKGQFLANMSHEIRTPMNGVLGMLHLLLDSELDLEQREFTQIAHDSGVALLNIINDILDFSRMEAGKLELHVVPFILEDMVSGVEMLLQDQANRKHIKLSSAIDSTIPASVCGDSPRLRQILINLVANALKFTSDGSVTLAARTSSTDRVRFEVRDTGIGIAPGVEKKLFEPFSQADGSITRKYGGAGLGLAISTQLVGLMGGEIGVESELGQGSTFWFEVPLPGS